YSKSGAFLSWSLVQDTFSLTLVGSLLELVAVGALLPVSAGTISNALMSMATFFSPMPRNPPTPTIKPTILPLLSNSMSLTSPTLALAGRSTLVPLNFENTNLSVPCAEMNLGLLTASDFAGVFAGGLA